MGTVSVRLHDGTVVAAEFQDNGDGRVTDDEKVRAQNALADALRGRASAQVDLYTEALITESGAPPETYRGSFSLGGLVNSGAVRLFGAPSTSNPTAVDSPGDWVAEGNENVDGRTYTIYREMSGVDPNTGQNYHGRRIRVPHDEAERARVYGGEREVSEGGRGSSWLPLGLVVNGRVTYTTGSLRIPTESLPPLQASEIPASRPVATAPVAWSPASGGPQGGYVYFEGPGGRLARRPLANPGNAQVMVRPGPSGNLAGAVWRAADDADAVPPVAAQPAQPAPPPAPTGTISVTDRGRLIDLTYDSAQSTGTDGQFYQIFTGPSDSRYRRTVDSSGSPIANTRMQRLLSRPGQSPERWGDVNPARPGVATGPRRAGGGSGTFSVDW